MYSYAVFWRLHKVGLVKFSVPDTLNLCYSLYVRGQVTNMKPTCHLIPFLLSCVMSVNLRRQSIFVHVSSQYTSGCGVRSYSLEINSARMSASTSLPIYHFHISFFAVYLFILIQRHLTVIIGYNVKLL